jgi:hypothetical protein
LWAHSLQNMCNCLPIVHFCDSNRTGTFLLRNTHTLLIKLYFSILLHCIVQWVFEVMFQSACSFIVCWFSLSFTTCFGLHGHLQVCRIFYFHMFEGFCFAAFLHCLFYVVTLCTKKQAHKHTRKETTKITKENSTGTKNRWKTCRV